MKRQVSWIKQFTCIHKERYGELSSFLLWLMICFSGISAQLPLTGIYCAAAMECKRGVAKYVPYGKWKRRKDHSN
jgi:hypothetical protein